MSVLIDDEVLKASGLTEAELRLELAVALFAREHLGMGGAARLANLPMRKFMDVLAERKIPPHYGVDELREDLAEVERLMPR